MRRRQVLTTLGALGVGLSAGCTELVFNDRAEYSASKATAGDKALRETGYQHGDTQEQTFEETVSAGGVERTIVATTWISTYRKSIDLLGSEQDAARFAVVSTPAIEIAGKSFNPVESMSHEELLERFKGQLSGQNEQLEDIEYVESRDEVVLGEETEVSTFSTTTTLQGQEVELYIHVATVAHEGDLIVAVGAHPAALTQERSNTYTLMRSIEHTGGE